MRLPSNGMVDKSTRAISAVMALAAASQVARILTQGFLYPVMPPIAVEAG
jgi:hypothetical protein